MNTKFENFLCNLEENVNDSMYYIFHHGDMDGYASASILIKALLNQGIWETSIRTYPKGYNNSWKNEMYIIDPKDKVFILDYSFSNKENQNILLKLYNEVTKDIYWIDHHNSSETIINSYKEFKDIADKGYLLTDNSYCGTMLTYCWVNGITVDKLNLDEVPMWIKLVDDYDCWKEQYEESHYLNSGTHYLGFGYCFTRLVYPDEYEDYIDSEAKYESLIADNFIYYIDPDNMINNICSIGAILDRNEAKNNKNFIKYKSFISKLEIPNERPITVLCANKMGNSSLFGDEFHKYDAVISFIFDGEYWTYKMFSASDKCNPSYTVDCSKYARYFGEKYGITGGGHVHAAGWSATEMHLEVIGKAVIE